MQEIREMQAYNRKEFGMLAVANFKHLLFRYRVLSKLNKLTSLPKDSLQHSSLKTQLLDLVLSTL
jgi:hypothetical protein